MPPKKKVRVSEPMTASGAADATVKSQGNYVRIANLFLAYIKEVSPELSAKWGEIWDAVPEKHAADTELYEHLATFVSSTYTIADGDKSGSKNLSSAVVSIYIISAN